MVQTKGDVSTLYVDEGIDVLPELSDGCEGGAAEGLAGKNGEPDFDLVEPRSAGGREVEVDVGMSLKPGLVALVGIEIVKDGMDLFARIEGDDIVHEGQELDAPTAFLVGGGDLACRQIECAQTGSWCRAACNRDCAR